MATRKHQNDVIKTRQKNHTCLCGSTYKFRQGLSSHRKKCTVEISSVVESSEEKDTHKIVDILIKENSDIKNIMLEIVKSNSELQKQLIEACQNNSITNNITHTNSHNKTFNLQIFLNEQCKDAMNMSEFVDSFDLKLSDLESVGKLGYVDGITKIFIDKLNSMDVRKRPMHCSDAKREILYIKDEDKWEREKPSNPKLRKAVRNVSFKNMKLAHLWSETYPESKSSESSLNDVYMKIVRESTGGSGEIINSEDKIIRQLTKGVVIDKNML